jgi:hypothetical protein
MAKVITMFGPSPYPSQTMIRGPRAIFGIMLSVTNNGNRASDKIRDYENTGAMPTLRTTAVPERKEDTLRRRRDVVLDYALHAGANGGNSGCYRVCLDQPNSRSKVSRLPFGFPVGAYVRAGGVDSA